jgi:penicillin-binding protein 1C
VAKIRFDKPIAKIIAALLIFLSISAITFWFFILKDLPDVKELSTRTIEVSTKIYDRNGVLLYKIYKDKNRTITPLSEIPENVKLATLAAEDAEFYKHKGFSVRGILRAFFNNLEKGQVSGGSTITQQLVKNALLSSEKTLTRKLKEIALAVEVELTYSKDQILEMYLNEVPFGGTAYGITEASNVYFGKDVKKLTTAEAAYLAGLPRSPSKYSPFSGNFEDGLARQKDVINLMKINGFITEGEKNQALNQKLAFASNRTDIKAPHFVMYVRNLLAEKYGEDAVETGGLDVVTTLDYSIQKLAEEVLQKEVEKLKPLHVGNGAVLILDPKTNEILAMVGSKDYFDIQNDGNVNVTLRPRSPGSSIKVVNYAYALSNNYTAGSIIDDSPVVYKVAGQPPYTPKNYDSGFHGKVTLRSALARSLNIPAVKVLNSYGVSNMIDLGEKMGITTWGDRSRFGLSLTLGGGEVKLIDLAKVYSVVADYGNKKDPVAIKKVTNYKGNVFEENLCQAQEKQNDSIVKTASAKEAVNSNQCKDEKVLDSRVAYILIDILRDNNARAPSFGRSSQLVIPGHPEVAVKTGTSNDLRDNLTVGFTQKYLVAVWVGNNDNSPMSRIASGLTGASTIFNKIMTGLLAKEVSTPWEIPQGLKQIAICTYTGTLPCPGCPTRAEWFLDEKRPGLACNPDAIIAMKKDEEAKQQGQILEPALSTQFVP